MIIYKLISPSGKIYIGQTSSNLELRFNQHINAWKKWSKNKTRKGFCTKLFYGFESYSPETWTKEIIYQTTLKEDLDEKESYFIKLYDSINNGYNITKGGNGRKVDFLDEDHKQNISNSRKEFFETEEGKQWKEKLSEKYSGKNNPMYGKGKEIGERNSKWFLVLDKDGNEQIIKNLYNFRKENLGKNIITFPNEYNSNFCKPCEFRIVQLKGYSECLEDNEKQKIINECRIYIKPIKRWKIISPTGKEYITDSLTKFCKEIPYLTSQNLGGVALGKHKDHKGWKSEFYIS